MANKFVKQGIIFFIILSTSLSSFATCPNAVTLLPEGTSAPCRGFLFTPEKELEVRIMSKDYDLLKEDLDLKSKTIDRLSKINKNSEDTISLEANKAELWRVRAEDSTKKLVEVTASRQERDLLWMLAGVVMTIGAGFAVHQAGK